MLVRAAQSYRPAAQPAACVRAHQQKHTRFPFQNRSSRSHDHKTHNNIKTMNYDDFMKQFPTSSELRKLWASESMDTDALVLPPPSWVQNVLKECVALGDNGTYIISFEDGDMAWSDGLVGDLCEDLDCIHRDNEKITAVALGRDGKTGGGSSTAADRAKSVHCIRVIDPSEDTYSYMHMDPGCAKDLGKLWEDAEGDDRVVRVAFAPGGGRFVFTQSGATSFEGLPVSLTDKLKQRQEDEDEVEQMSIGHNGEWFVLFESGAYFWEGVHPTLNRLLQEGKVGSRARRKGSRASRTRVQWVELGPSGSFVALFDDRTVWYGSEALTEQLLSCV